MLKEKIKLIIIFIILLTSNSCSWFADESVERDLVKEKINKLICKQGESWRVKSLSYSLNNKFYVDNEVKHSILKDTIYYPNPYYFELIFLNSLQVKMVTYQSTVINKPFLTLAEGLFRDSAFVDAKTFTSRPANWFITINNDTILTMLLPYSNRDNSLFLNRKDIYLLFNNKDTLVVFGRYSENFYIKSNLVKIR